MSIYPVKWGATPQEKKQLRQSALEIIRQRGGDQIPAPPRSLVAQPASRSIKLTWNADPNQHPCVNWRVYVGTELQVYRELVHGVRQCEISATTGASPNKVNIWVSAYNPFNGKESQKIYIQGLPAVETAGAAPPLTPPPPPQWTKEPTGGSGKNKNLEDREYSGRGQFTN